jgi:hypothetical protein
METYNIKGKHPLRQFYKSCSCKGFKKAQTYEHYRFCDVDTQKYPDYVSYEALMKFPKCPYCRKEYQDVEEPIGIPLGRGCDEDGNGYFRDFIPIKTFIELMREIENEK